MSFDPISFASQLQSQATNPSQSFWVSASAGTGKTKVLVDRYIRLLLNGASIPSILCLTFTKAAASEMQERVLSVLKSFVHLSDVALVEKIHPFVSEPTANVLYRARTLFAGVVDELHQVRIQTIHAFCQSILQKFPMEADLDPTFSVLNDTHQRELIERAYEDIFQDAFWVSNGSPLQSALEHFANEMSLFSFEEQKGKILGHFQSFVSLFRGKSLDSILGNVQKKLGLSDAEISWGEDVFFDQMPLEFKVCPDPEVRAIVAKLPLSFDDYQTSFLTQKGEVLKRLKHPVLILEAQRVRAWLNFQKTQFVFQDTRALLTVSFAFLSRYQELKKNANMLDFDDLILKMADLLHHPELSGWVLFKTDGDIHHILVDEAQDTSPVQWKIIEALTAEFFSVGASEKNAKTLFVVGDKKQSIYRFQGADVKSFETSYAQFDEKLKHQKYPLSRVPLSVSFRTAPVILEFVDSVFKRDGKGVRSESEAIKHVGAFARAGRIEIFPVFEKESGDADEVDFLRPSVDILSRKSVGMRFCEEIADHIKKMLDDKIKLPSTGHQVQPKDILILVQKRAPLAPLLARALKDRGIPFEGIDRFHLKNDLAVADLLACARFSLFPRDDLNTAALLKSTLIGLSESDLFQVCFNRGEKSVFEMLSESDSFKAVVEFLNQLIARRGMSPFEFFCFVLEDCEGRYRLLKSLGEKHAEALDSFWEFAFDFSDDLIHFLTSISFLDPAVKKEFSKENLMGVRLMSVHGAKGLESPVVILPDTTRDPMRSKETIFFDVEGVPFFAAYSARRNDFLNTQIDAEKQMQLEESRRLLYVALTRAKDYLVIFGVGKVSTQSWYDLIESSVGARSKESDGAVVFGDNFEVSTEALSVEAVFENRLILPVNFSVLAEPDFPEPVLMEAEMGTKVHAFIQQMTALSQENAVQFISEKVGVLGLEEWSSVFLGLCAPEFSFLFASDSLSEVEMMTPSTQFLRLDKLCFVQGEVWIVDYKTDKNFDFLPVYQKQLKKYINSVKDIYKTTKIRAFILWLRPLKMKEVL